MHTFLFFLVKFFPVWSVALFIILIPLAYNFLRLRKYIAFVIVIIISIVLSLILYFYIANDGYKNAVDFVRQFIVN